MASAESLYLDGSSLFEPLPNPTEQVRLLDISLVESEHDLIRCTLHNVNVDGQANYVAVSMRQTLEAFDHAILCNEKLVLVTRTLYNSLALFRQKGLQRLWVEQLCVDVRNASEQEHQQALKVHIYQGASTLILAPFQYEDLPSAQHVRLIEIQRAGARSTSSLVIRTCCVSLDSCPEYTLLTMTSDQWEAGGAGTRVVVVDWQGLAASWAVMEALRLVQLTCPGRKWFWFEPICVNPRDGAEGSHHQVLAERIRERAKNELAINFQEYQYRPLNGARHEIRLLSVRAAEARMEQLVVEMKIVSLDDKPTYNALSYVWGSYSRDRAIYSPNGTRFLITPNLWHAMHAVRDTFPEGAMLWADQICINQEDVLERNSQVLMMNRIYRQASNVIIHLAGQIRQYHIRQHWYPLLRIVALTARTLQCVRPENVGIDEAEFAQFGIPPFSHVSWKLLQIIRSNPWFSRGWVIQEAFEGGQVWGIFNGQRFNFDDLHLASSTIKTEAMPTSNRDMVIGRRLLNDFSSLRPPPMRSVDSRFRRLADLLITFRYVHTSDPRDKIYAFRGMAVDADSYPLPAYDASVEQIYRDYAQQFIRNGHGLELLREAGLSKSSASISTPSWVPDWSYNAHSGACNFSRSAGFPPIVRLPDPSQSHVVMEVLGGSSTLSSAGAIVDTITGLTSEYRASNTTPEQSLVTLDQEAQLLLHQLADSRVYNEPHPTIFARTLIGDHQPMPNIAAVYHDLIADMKIVVRHGRDSDEARSIQHAGETASPPPQVKYAAQLNPTLLTRHFGITASGYMGLMLHGSRVGDQICLFRGADTPFVIRPADDSERGRHQLVGDAYVHGMMHGEAWDIKGVKSGNILLV